MWLTLHFGQKTFAVDEDRHHRLISEGLASLVYIILSVYIRMICQWVGVATSKLHEERIWPHVTLQTPVT